ncbi:hypothetical protein CXR29_13930 [Brevibacterium linens]|nr:hypothetical protein CXR29_13930 [Brevibacterium linens]
MEYFVDSVRKIRILSAEDDEVNVIFKGAPHKTQCTQYVYALFLTLGNEEISLSIGGPGAIIRIFVGVFKRAVSNVNRWVPLPLRFMGKVSTIEIWVVFGVGKTSIDVDFCENSF